MPLPTTNTAPAASEEDGVREGHPLDRHVGRRVRLRRTLLGLTQQELGEQIGVTFQQIQKYERGTNRISASRLWEIARVLKVPVSFFFEDFREDDDAAHETEENAISTEELRLLVAFNRLNKKQQTAILAFLEGSS
ncbi:helix-turn-helix domain-containing protein [Caenispirillum bisanense]|uniref:Transcriptional regulator, contains XRE-family HTH domain n=1 Tax=Caenispirillum bisanense TaxID=414052 RepID=A0A286GVX9_9PROT|nr:helix-turn-helix domain-containing protein [Caenispirillum bisanense]SOD99239.1 Transcriptional regulator, contains XRE-family HTH domain [Caenispirillum bisanense]